MTRKKVLHHEGFQFQSKLSPGGLCSEERHILLESLAGCWYAALLHHGVIYLKLGIREI
jgi:hypothetical protein